MPFLLLIVWISTGKKKMAEVVTFVTYDCLSHFPESLHEAFAPPTDFQNWNKDLNISYSLFFFLEGAPFQEDPKRMIALSSVTYFSVIGRTDLLS